MKKKWGWLDSACLIMIAAGVWVTMNVGMIGSSNMYFMMAIYPVVLEWFLLHVDQVKHMKLWIAPLLIVIIISFRGFLVGYGEDSMPALVSKGYTNYFGKECTEYDPLNRSYISKSQYEAYDFIRNHTNSNTLITTNKVQEVVGVFTERYVIGKGTENPVFMATNSEEQNQAIENCRKNKVEYIVYDKVTSPEFELLGRGCEECFQNDSTIIYHILE